MIKKPKGFFQMFKKKNITSNETNWLKQDVSSKYKQQVFNAVRPELEINKIRSQTSTTNINWVWSAAASLAFATIIFIRMSGLIHVESPSSTFDDLALLTPEEIEVVENLDLLDKIKYIDLDEIRKEMKQKGNES